MLVEYYIYFSSFKIPLINVWVEGEHSHLASKWVSWIESQESLGLHLSGAVNGQTGIDGVPQRKSLGGTSNPSFSM